MYRHYDVMLLLPLHMDATVNSFWVYIGLIFFLMCYSSLHKDTIGGWGKYRKNEKERKQAKQKEEKKENEEEKEKK